MESVSGGGRYAYGSDISIDAALLPGYHWKNWTGTFTLADRTYSFKMPARNVELTAEGEANTCTIRFDPNTGKEVTRIPDITTAYDRKVTLPDAAGCYVRFTLDGEDITQEVLDGTIVLSGDGTAMTAEEAEAERQAEEAAGTAELAGEAAEMLPGTEEADRAAEEREDRAEPEQETGGADAVMEQDTKEAPVPDRKAYASVFTGWSLEDGKDTYVPRWKHGEEMNASVIADAAGVTDTDGAVITLYAVWDDCPWITAEDLYYTLEQAQKGEITEEEILSYPSAYDREDGSPVAPGTNPVPGKRRLHVIRHTGFPPGGLHGTYRRRKLPGNADGDGQCRKHLQQDDRGACGGHIPAERAAGRDAAFH